jgi:hypothetical protein
LTVEQQTALGKGNFGLAPKLMPVLNFAIAVGGRAQRPQPMDDEEYKWKSPTALEMAELRAMS